MSCTGADRSMRSRFTRDWGERGQPRQFGWSNPPLLAPNSAESGDQKIVIGVAAGGRRYPLYACEDGLGPFTIDLNDAVEKSGGAGETGGNGPWYSVSNGKCCAAGCER